MLSRCVNNICCLYIWYKIMILFLNLRMYFFCVDFDAESRGAWVNLIGRSQMWAALRAEGKNKSGGNLWESGFVQSDCRTKCLLGQKKNQRAFSCSESKYSENAIQMRTPDTSLQWVTQKREKKCVGPKFLKWPNVKYIGLFKIYSNMLLLCSYRAINDQDNSFQNQNIRLIVLLLQWVQP